MRARGLVGTWAARGALAALAVALFSLAGMGGAAATTYDCTPMSSSACKMLQPVAECVWDNHDGTRTALWGWDNPTTDSAHIPPSNKNNMSPGAEDQGQPTLFGPGRQLNIFTTTFAGTTATWHLGNNDASVDTTTTMCGSKPVSQVGSMRALGLALLLLVGSGLAVLFLKNHRQEVTA